MLGATAMSSEERRRMALEMARLRAARYTTTRDPSRRLPEALPCHDYAKAFANVAVPMGVVEMRDRAELQPWLLVARPVSRKEAEKNGGCIMFTPPCSTAKSSSSSSSSAAAGKPLYFRITDTDDEVYGRAAYLPRSGTTTDGISGRNSTRGTRNSVSASSQQCRSYPNDCTAEELSDVQE
jgi:hypothetical protein